MRRDVDIPMGGRCRPEKAHFGRARFIGRWVSGAVVYLYSHYLTFEALHILAARNGLGGEAQWFLLVPPVPCAVAAIVLLTIWSRRWTLLRVLYAGFFLALGASLGGVIFAYAVQWLSR